MGVRSLERLCSDQRELPDVRRAMVVPRLRCAALRYATEEAASRRVPRLRFATLGMTLGGAALGMTLGGAALGMTLGGAALGMTLGGAALGMTWGGAALGMTLGGAALGMTLGGAALGMAD
jgi:hypothetical protein